MADPTLTAADKQIPDLWAFLPAKSYGPTALWIEVKAAGGKVSPAQGEFAARCFHADVNYILRRIR